MCSYSDYEGKSPSYSYVKNRAQTIQHISTYVHFCIPDPPAQPKKNII